MYLYILDSPIIIKYMSTRIFRQNNNVFVSDDFIRGTLGIDN